MIKLLKKGMTTVLCAAILLTSAAGLSGCGSSDGKDAGGKKELTFQIWDVAQKEGMEALASAYTEENPDVTIEVQVTSWDEYWTKL